MLDMSGLNINHISRKGKDHQFSDEAIIKRLHKGNAESENNTKEFLKYIKRKEQTYKQLIIASDRSLSYIKRTVEKLVDAGKVEKHIDYNKNICRNEVLVKLA